MAHTFCEFHGTKGSSPLSILIAFPRCSLPGNQLRGAGRVTINAQAKKRTHKIFIKSGYLVTGNP